MYRYRRYYYGPRYGPGPGYGAGYGRGFGPGRRWSSPYCDWYPDRPRGWWAMPEYTTPPEGAEYNTTTGYPSNQEAIDYEISMVEKTIEDLKKEIIRLKSLKSNDI